VNLALQNRLDIADRKIQVHESALKSLAQERDSAVTQLGVAYLNTQDTKRENENLKKENAELKSHVSKLSTLVRQFAGNDTTTQSLPKTQQNTEHITISTDNNEGYPQRTSGSTRARGQSKEQNQCVPDDPQSRVLGMVEREISRMEKERQDEDLFSLNLSRPATANQESATRSTAPFRSGETERRKLPNTGKQRIKRVIVEEADTTELFTEDIRDDVKSQTGADKDFTLLSFIDDREIAKLRRRLEAERAARKQQQSAATREQSVNASTAKRVASDPPRKSSLKEPKTQVARPSSALSENPTTDRGDLGDREDSGAAGRRRRHSDHSVASHSRRKKAIPELTSAFILPDITLRYAETEPVRLSESAQKVLDSVAGHDGRNCTVCKRLLPEGVTHKHEEDHRETISIPKPVPVSERMPEPSIYNEEPTLRPSRPPAVALATVLKGLEDELSHLKMQLAVAQSSFSKHDASLGKRQRKSLSTKIEKLLKEIDTKADQIYALYDVLEGQKQEGHEMTEKEMEVTLQSIGIDVHGAGNLTGATDESFHRKTQSVHVDDSDEDYDVELPWEGFESTADITGRHTSRSVNL
jgi:Centrosome microtubule-binding domain of Cep57/Centrosome localisation domain of PPC89